MFVFKTSSRYTELPIWNEAAIALMVVVVVVVMVMVMKMELLLRL